MTMASTAFYGRIGTIIVDQDRPLGTLNRDGPLIADPAQAVLILEFSIGFDPHVCSL